MFSSIFIDNLEFVLVFFQDTKSSMSLDVQIRLSGILSSGISIVGAKPDPGSGSSLVGAKPEPGVAVNNDISICTSRRTDELIYILIREYFWGIFCWKKYVLLFCCVFFSFEKQRVLWDSVCDWPSVRLSTIC